VQLLDTMIFVYYRRAGLLGSLLSLPELGLTTPVRRELRRWPEVSAQVEPALRTGRLALLDMDPSDEVQRTAYVLFRDGDGLGDGESATMTVARAHGCAFVSHDTHARSRAANAGIRVLDWPDLLAEMRETGIIDEAQRRSAKRAISGLMRGR
jgi:predicted nucleic acid-binding protein